MRDRRAIVAAGLSFAVSVALLIRVVSIDKPEVIALLAPPVIGALVAMRRPTERRALALALALTVPTAVLSLIGGVGLLYVPTIALFAWAAVRPASAPAVA